MSTVGSSLGRQEEPMNVHRGTCWCENRQEIMPYDRHRCSIATWPVFSSQALVTFGGSPPHFLRTTRNPVPKPTARPPIDKVVSSGAIGASGCHGFVLRNAPPAIGLFTAHNTGTRASHSRPSCQAPPSKPKNDSPMQAQRAWLSVARVRYTLGAGAALL